MKSPYGPQDDGFHFDAMSGRWWETETSWFSFHNVERRLGGWIYVMVRPNIGTVAGGIWIWDDTAWLPWDCLYCANYTTLRLREHTDLRDATFPTGVSIRVVEPLTSYQLRFTDERLVVDLRFDAVIPPQPLTTAGSPFGHLNHFDQFGRVHGSVQLLGEYIEIDCLSMRDRSWEIGRAHV